MNRMCLVLIHMNNRMFGPYLAATHSILNSAMRGMGEPSGWTCGWAMEKGGWAETKPMPNSIAVHCLCITCLVGDRQTDWGRCCRQVAEQGGR
jgi:hypothetical protein